MLFDQARVLVEHGDFADACPKFAESQRIDPGIGTMLWLADCYENSGQTASAWAAFKAAAGMAALRHDDRERVAHERVANLEPKLTLLDIAVPQASALEGLRIRRDGVVVGNAEWGIAMPVDPGSHVIAAEAPGFRPWSTVVETASNGAVENLTIPRLMRASARFVAGSVSLAPTGGRGASQRVAGLSVAGAGLAAMLFGAFFSFRAKAIYDESNDGNAPHCLPDNECDAAGKKFRSDANSLATTATIAMGAGAAGLIGGAVLYLTAPASPPAGLAIASGPSGASVRLRWGW